MVFTFTTISGLADASLGAFDAEVRVMANVTVLNQVGKGCSMEYEAECIKMERSRKLFSDALARLRSPWSTNRQLAARSTTKAGLQLQ